MSLSHPDSMRTTPPGLDSLSRAMQCTMDSTAMGGSPRGLVLFDKGCTGVDLLLEAGVEVTVVHDHPSDLESFARIGVKTMLLSDLLARKSTWDVSVLVSGFDRYLRVSSDHSRQRLYGWLAQHCTVSLISAPRRVLDSTLNLLGPYRLGEISDNFAFVSEISPSEVPSESPILVASDSWLFVGDTWHRDGDLHLVKRSGNSQDFEARSACFLTNDDRVIKTDLVNTDYFERSPILREALFLLKANKNTARQPGFPTLSGFSHGQAVVTSVREVVPGSTQQHGAALAESGLCTSLVELCRTYAQSGLFHNDLRPWNVLWDGDVARLIDFADTSTRDADTMGLPQVVALIGTLLYFRGFPIRADEAFSGDLVELLLGPDLDVHSLPASLFDGPWLSLASMNEHQARELAEHPLRFWEQICSQHGVSSVHERDADG